MTVTQEVHPVTRRGLIVRDTIAFVSLIGIAVVLFVATLFLFRSYSGHRVELAQRWYARGERDLAAGRPDDAVGALRTALSYAPGERDYELKLAEALEKAGKTDEAFAYFSTLWDAEPGSGQLNLELARLEVKKGDQGEAVRYYHAAIYGTWEGDGLERRRATRMELVQYLLRRRELVTARDELLIAAGNNADDPDLELEAAPMMAQTGDLLAALDLYKKVIAARPADLDALKGGGKAAYDLGRYATARKLLKEAERLRGERENSAHTPNGGMLDQSERILQLYPASNLPIGERLARIMHMRELARARLSQCEQPSAGDIPGGSFPNTTWQQLDLRWKAEGNDKAVVTAMRSDASQQRAEIQLAYDTEVALNQLCGAALGDDALLALIAKSPEMVEQ